jgi:hypothetical protein
MDILEVVESKVIRVTVRKDELMSELVREYKDNGWDFLNQYYGEHPEHGQVSYLRFSKLI